MKVKVLHLISSPFDIGGAESLLLDMSEIYDPAQFDISYCNLFCAPDKESRFNQQIRKRGLRDLSFGGNSILGIPRVIVKLASLIRRERFDIVHTHLTHATFIGWIAIRLARVSRFVTSHHYTNDIFQNSDITLSRKFASSLGSFAARRADRVIAVSNAVKKDLVSDNCLESKIEVIHNGIKLNDLDARIEAEPAPTDIEWHSSSHILATVGSLTERKGHSTAIKALPNILQQFPKSILLILGDGELKDALSELAEKLKVADSVIFLGFRSNVASYLKLSNLYVHPAIQEPFGIAILEAMAASKCVVATNVGGISEIVVENTTGYLIPPSQPDLLADAVCKSFADREKMSQMGNAGRQRVIDFDIKNVVAGYQKLYLELVAK